MFTTDEAPVERARAIADVVRDLLRAHAVAGELTLTGGNSLPGLLTKGDIDLHLRVSAADFDDVVGRLRGVADAAHPEIWTDTFATFERIKEPIVGARSGVARVAGFPRSLPFGGGFSSRVRRSSWIACATRVPCCR